MDFFLMRFLIKTLPTYLFAVYIDDLITHLKNSVYGIYVRQIFTGCALYADDITLLSASCNGYRT